MRITPYNIDRTAWKNSKWIKKRPYASCYHCMKEVDKDSITEWAEYGKKYQTAVCPHCGLDSVASTVNKLSEEFLREANRYWFKKWK